MKAFLLLCCLALCLALTKTTDIEPCVDCPTYAPAVRCPDCVNNRCTPAVCGVPVSVPHPDDCNKFCVCDSAGAFEMICPAGLVWENANQRCNWPANPICDSSAPYPGCDAPVLPAELAPPPKCATTPAPGPVIRCPACITNSCTPAMCNEAVTRPYPGDCSKFCICDHAGAIQMNCPAGLQWNASTESCDWPSFAKCDNNAVIPGC